MPGKVLFALLLTICGGQFFVYAQSVTIKPDTYFQEYGVAGASAGLYIGNYISLPKEEQETMIQWLGQDMNFGYIKNYLGDYIENETNKYVNTAQFFHDLLVVNPEAKFVVVANNLPDHLEKKDSEGVAKKGEFDESIAGIYDSIAGYYHHILKAHYDLGVPVEILEPLNEPGGDNYAIKKGKLFTEAIPRLRAILADEMLNPEGIKMPKVMGPSCWSVEQTLKWIKKWKSDLPDAFENTDIIGTHGYILGWDAEIHHKIYDLIEGKPFINTEQTGKLKDNDNLINDGISEDDAFDGALGISQRLVQGVTGGLNHFFAFLTHNPKINNAALVSIQSKKVYRSKMYWAFRQLNSLQPKVTNRVERNRNNMSYMKVLTLRKKDEDTVFVHMVNTEPTLTNVKFNLKNSDTTFGIRRIQGWVTDIDSTMGMFMDESYVVNEKETNIDIKGHSVTTLKIAFNPNGVEDETPLSSSSILLTSSSSEIVSSSDDVIVSSEDQMSSVFLSSSLPISSSSNALSSSSEDNLTIIHGNLDASNSSKVQWIAQGQNFLELLPGIRTVQVFSFRGELLREYHIYNESLLSLHVEKSGVYLIRFIGK